MRRKLLWAALAGAAAVVLAVAKLTAPSPAQPPLPKKPGTAVPQAPAAQLPVSHVVLFSSGVGYFQREGDVEGTARIDLTFPAGDINDLLKSLVLEDRGGGRISTVGYDSPDPVEKTLKSFALDLTNNPSLGQLLNQARGEKVEVVLQPSNNVVQSTLTGVILGMESQRQPQGKDGFVEVDLLNLLCAEGLRCVGLKDVLRVRFLNPVLDSELRRALDVLAAAHDSQKKVVSLGFKGEGKRAVRVGYVVESPIWKSSYRLVLGKGGAVHLQGWASVENTTDEDWSGVRMALVSGRPISFQMNLYQPLFVPRPLVEPETFASLRPPVYGGAMANFQRIGLPANPGDVNPDEPVRKGGFQGGFGGIGGALGAGGIGGFQGGFGGGLGFGGGQNLGGLGGFQGGPFNPYFNRYQPMAFGQLGAQFGQQGGAGNDLPGAGRLSFEELQRRRQQQQQAKEEAKKAGAAIAALDPTRGVGALPTAEEVGDYYRYVIDDKVTLPRQKSAMLPVVNQGVEAVRVSIYNQQVQAKFPLLGLKFKNTTDQPLTQGPVTVYEEGSYAGDARLPDLQPKEERLVSYAIDQGTEVKPEVHGAPQQLIAVKVAKGVLRATHKLRETKRYAAKNRSPQDRLLIIEHPVRPDWKLVAPAKPAEQSRDFYRFEVPVPAGKGVTYEVVEEQSRTDQLAVSGIDDRTITLFINSDVSSKEAKEGLKRVLDLRAKLATTRSELVAVEKELKAITDDQGRLRQNLEKLPPTSGAYKRYVEKFDKQETEIEKLQDQIKKMQETLKAHEKEFGDFILGADW